MSPKTESAPSGKSERQRTTTERRKGGAAGIPDFRLDYLDVMKFVDESGHPDIVEKPGALNVSAGLGISIGMEQYPESPEQPGPGGGM